MSKKAPKAKNGFFPTSLMDSALEEELRESLQPESIIPEKTWYIDYGMPLLKNPDVIFAKEKPPGKNAQSFVFHHDGNLTHGNIDIPTGEKYSTISTGEWLAEEKVFKIKYEGSIYVDMMERNERNESQKKTKLKRIYKGYAEFIILDCTVDRIVLRKRIDPIYKEKIMEDEK